MNSLDAAPCCLIPNTLHGITTQKTIQIIFIMFRCIYRGADKSLARPTSRCILFDGQNISLHASLVMYINSSNIPPIMIINTIYEKKNLLSLWLVSFLVGLRTYQHPCICLGHFTTFKITLLIVCCYD